MSLPLLCSLALASTPALGGAEPPKAVGPPSVVLIGTVAASSGAGAAFTPAFRVWLGENQPDLAVLADEGRVFRAWDHTMVTLTVTEVLVDRTDRKLEVGQSVTVYAPEHLVGVVSSEALVFLDRYVGSWGEAVPPFSEASSSFVVARGEENPLRQEASWSAHGGTGRCLQGCTWDEMLTTVRERTAGTPGQGENEE